MNSLLVVSLRQQAVYVPSAALDINAAVPLQETTAVLVANLRKLGFTLSEPLLRALNAALPAYQIEVLDALRGVLGVNRNWTPLVKDWLVPTGENVTDHMISWFVNLVGGRGTQLACGHLIPPGTFPLERYNGCPFCGTPFESGKIEIAGQNDKLKVLQLWGDAEVLAFYRSLLQSKTPLDATQVESLGRLTGTLPLPEGEIGMKETRMLVIDQLVGHRLDDRVQPLFQSPTDILRYLWFKKTGFLQIVEPKTIARRTARNAAHLLRALDSSAAAKAAAESGLKLKYSRKECRRVAVWLNGLTLPPAVACEHMHPKRRLWVRFIRALRLVEYARRPEFGPLAALLDAFHRQTYLVFGGQLEKSRLRQDPAEAFRLLKQRPGLFARSLFANMLWFGPEAAIAAFSGVIAGVPARLVFTLNAMADQWFSGQSRTVKPLGGTSKSIPAHRLLASYDESRRASMKSNVEDLCLLAMRTRFAGLRVTGKTMFIDPGLFKMPVSIGDRSGTVQDLPAALMGTRFPVEGDVVRLFMQWGTGLKAQHLDMDLSCLVIYDSKVEICSFSRLAPAGCKHSGDIRRIPDDTGTAEYIEINLPELAAAGSQYVIFTGNAYSHGAIAPNLVLGWMNCRHPMQVSESTGVAYDPSCVQHQVRITGSMTKGLVFGMLEIAAREIVWLEMPFGGQVVQNMDKRAAEGLLAKLNAKLSIGTLLKLKAEAQGLTLRETPDADENYTREWAMDAAAVTSLLVD